MNVASPTDNRATQASMSTSRSDGDGLTGRQQDVLRVITDYCRATDEACSASYIARRLSIHHSTVQQHLWALHRKGWLRGPNPPAMPQRWLK